MRNPRLFALMTVALWSFFSLLYRLMSVRSEFLLLALSFTFTLATHVIYGWRVGGRFPLVDRRVWRPRALALGSLGYFVYSASLNQCFRAFNTASEPTLLNYTWPLFTVVFTSALYRRGRGRPRLVQALEWLGIGLGFGSVALVATGGRLDALQLANPVGLAWGLFAGAAYGVFSAYSSTISQEEHGAFLLSAIVSSWVLMVAAALTELPLVATLRWADLLVVAPMGCLLNGIGYILWTRANRLAYEQGLSVSAIASLTLALPLLNLVWVSLAFRESAILRPGFALSVLLIILSTMLCQQAGAIGEWWRTQRERRLASHVEH